MNSDYEGVQHAIEESGATNSWLCRKTGLAYNTVRSIRRGEANPTARTLRLIKETILEPDGKRCCSECRHCEAYDLNEDGSIDVFCMVALGVKHDADSCAAFSEEDNGTT